MFKVTIKTPELLLLLTLNIFHSFFWCFYYKFEYENVCWEVFRILFNSIFSTGFWYLAGSYMFKFNNRNTRARRERCSKLTKTPERCYWRRSGVSIVNFKHISHFVIVFLLLTLNM